MSRIHAARIRIFIACIVASAVVLTPTPTQAEITSGGDASELHIFDFEEFDGIAGPSGTAFNSLISQEYGIRFGEKLLGQVNQPFDGYDLISGTPDTPLALDDDMAPELGVNVMSIFGTTVLAGLGPSGFPNPDAIGDGALTVLFDVDQRVVAFDLVGTNFGTVTLTFLDRQGAELGTVELTGVYDTTHVFSSGQSEIAAINFSNTDWGGLAFDNFHFQPVVQNEIPVCAAGGPYETLIEDSYAHVELNANLPDNPKANWQLGWVTDCPNAFFDDDTASNPVLSIEAYDCQLECTVSLLVYGDETVDVCTATVTATDPQAGPTVTCPSDVIAHCGDEEIPSLDEWLNSATATGAVPSNDFDGLIEGCGETAEAVVTWWVDNEAGSTCNGQTSCTATYQLIDNDPPAFEAPESVMLLDVDCDGFETWEPEQIFATDACSGDVEIMIEDDQGDYPAGETSLVTLSATDACGNTTTTEVRVNVEANSGLEIRTTPRRRGHRRRGSFASQTPPTARVYDFSRGSCARSFHNGKNARGFGRNTDFVGKIDHVLNTCEPIANARLTGNSGEINLATGKYLVLLGVDDNGDEQYDRWLARKTGYINCGQWKTVTFRP
ncbi:MAG: hypothetical protein ACPGXK_06330 [Phycisphaerae bacterium]